MGKSTINVPDYEKYIDLAFSRPGQDVRYAISCNYLKQYGWKPKKEFDKSIVDIVNYYKKEFIW